MKFRDVTETLNMALEASGCDSAKVIRKELKRKVFQFVCQQLHWLALYFAGMHKFCPMMDWI